jgi:SAM-dependent methyltransferase
MEWFEEWFDSKYYHILYQNRDEKEAQSFIDFLLEEVDLKTNAKILDLACGKGRHSQYFASLGHDVTGVDLSANSIAIAKENEKENLHFEVRDMRVSFKEDYFDLVANLFTSFGYFDDVKDNSKVLNSIETMMNEDGHFVIDFMNVEKAIRALVPSEEKEIDGVIFKITRKVEDGNIVKDITVEDNGKTFHFQEKVQALTIDNFKELIAKTDLVVDGFYGSYNLSIFDADVSDRLIIIGTKW